jgi:hypothetical protein
VEPVDKFYDHWGASLQAKVLHSLWEWLAASSKASE